MARIFLFYYREKQNFDLLQRKKIVQFRSIVFCGETVLFYEVNKTNPPIPVHCSLV